MTTLRPQPAAPYATPHYYAPEAAPDDVASPPRRTRGPMRQYEFATLTPSLNVTGDTVIAPAKDLFEQATSAFARGTPLPTQRGAVPVEDLLPGDYLETSAGAQPVMWIGSTTYVPGRDEEETTLTHLTRVTADAFGMGNPGFDLLLGPGARMRVTNPRLKDLLGQDSVLAPVQDYIDGDRLLTVMPAGAVQLFHILLPRHALLEVGGLMLESYHPGSDTLGRLDKFERETLLRLFPQLQQLQDFGNLSLTRTRREVIERLISV